MMNAVSITDKLKNYENFTSEGWQPLLECQHHKELTIETLAQILFIYQRVEFQFNDLYYEILTVQQVVMLLTSTHHPQKMKMGVIWKKIYLMVVFALVRARMP